MEKRIIKRSLLIMAGGRCSYLQTEMLAIFNTTLYTSYDIIVSVELAMYDDCIKDFLKEHSSKIKHILYHNYTLESTRKLTKIANHYKFAFYNVFKRLNYNICIVMEDDLKVIGDFFSYFLQLERVFLNDHTIFSINSMNHHSHRETAFNSYHIYRMESYNSYTK